MSLTDIHHFDYAVLLCERMPETRAFYRDVMKFRIEEDRENWVSFRIGATLLTLRPRGGLPFAADGPGAPGSASVQLCFRVPPSAFDACYAELLAADVEVVREPTDLPAWRHRTLFFRDPEGNLIEIYAEI